MRVPISFVGEYRGAKAASEFVRDGTTIQAPPRLKFEYVAEDGEPDLIDLPSGQFDMRTKLDWAKLNVGDRVSIQGVAVIADRNSDQESYVRVTAAALESAKPQAARAA